MSEQPQADRSLSPDEAHARARLNLKYAPGTLRAIQRAVDSQAGRGALTLEGTAGLEFSNQYLDAVEKTDPGLYADMMGYADALNRAVALQAPKYLDQPSKATGKDLEEAYKDAEETVAGFVIEVAEAVQKNPQVTGQNYSGPLSFVAGRIGQELDDGHRFEASDPALIGALVDVCLRGTGLRSMESRMEKIPFDADIVKAYEKDQNFSQNTNKAKD